MPSYQGLLTLAIFVFMTAHVVWVMWHSLRKIRRPVISPWSEREAPRAQVVLSLKGLDPFLDRCFSTLAEQDYPNYRIMVVIDSYEDPAWEQAEKARQIYGDLIQLKVRTNSGRRSSRKIQNLLSAFATLDPETEVVVMCDGDAVVHSGWLSELVDGLSDPKVGAVSGARWYSPPSNGLASLSRHYWNAMAIPTTQTQNILWAGSLALRRSVVDEPEFLERFSRSFGDDTAIAMHLNETGRKYHVLDSTYVVNSETIDLKNYWNFLVRQMLSVRLHHPKWPGVFAHAMLLAAGILCLAVLLVFQNRYSFQTGRGGFILFGLTLTGLATLYDWRLRRTFPEWKSLHTPVTATRVLMAFPALWLTAVIYPAACLMAALTRKHVWRGVEYHFSNGEVTHSVDLENVKSSQASLGQTVLQPGTVPVSEPSPTLPLPVPETSDPVVPARVAA